MSEITKAISIFDKLAVMSDSEAIRINEQYGTHNYHPLPVNIVSGKGALAYDGNGKEFYDCIGSYSAVANGHLSPGLVEVTKKQLEKVTLTSRAVYTSELALFLKTLCEFTGFDMACPMNTGAEAVETAIKLARKWAYTKKGVPNNQAEILVAEGNFHGRTTTIISFSTEEAYRENFGPFTPGFKAVPFGDIAALEASITPNTAAILMEPIQAEGGIIFPPAGYLEQVRELCNKHNVLLIWDEIQTGFCRTGKRFAWQHENAKPDMMCLGKALGGGIMPVSAVVGIKDVMSVFQPGDHGSTFGGNPLAAVVATATMDEMVEMDLENRSHSMGELLKEEFRNLNHPMIVDVRGQGLLIGLEVSPECDSAKLTDLLLEEGVLTKETRSHTFRFAPPLIINESDVKEIANRVHKALARL